MDKHSAPAYSFGQKIRSSTAGSTPAPNKYTQNFKTVFGKSPNTVFGSELRSSPAKKNSYYMPGPGRYNISKQLQKLSYSFGTEHRTPQKKNKTPGPGEYQVTISPVRRKSPKYTMLQRRETAKASSNFPGPGTYQVGGQFSKKNSFSYSRGNDSTPQRRSTINLLDQSTTAKGFTISPKLNDLLSAEKMKVPGPGAYKHKTSIGQGPNYSFGLKNQSISDALVPGPGQYQLPLDKPKTPGLSKGSRFTNLANQIPGPDRYSPNKNQGVKGMIFGKEQRLKSASNTMPGPGYYLIPSAISNIPQYAKRKAI